MDVSPVLAIAIPAIGVFAIALAGRFANANVREAVTMVTALSLFGAVTQLVPIAFEGGLPAQTITELVPGVPIAFHLEPLGMIFALVASSLWILNSIYSIGYMRGNKEKHQTRFFICFALSITCVMALCFAANLVTMFICYEALSLATYPLVTHKGSPESLKSGRTYLGILVGTSVCLFLPAIIATYVITGTIAFEPGGVFQDALASGKLSPGTYGVIFAMFMYGIGKAALMPSHRWLPAAMVAPTPVSALLHAVAVVKAGVFSLTKVAIYTIGIDTLREYGQGGWLLYAAGFTIVVASFIAMFQDNLKRRLAYSTISQLSYITLGVALLWPISITAAALHIAAHAFGKITLFFAAGSIYTAAHKTLVSQLDGIGRRMPITMGAFTIGTLSMIGLPPTAGFISKWYLLSGAWKAEQTFAVVVIATSTLLNAAYFLPIVYRAFFRAPPADSPPHGEAPLPILIAISGTALCAVSMFFYPDIFHKLATLLAGSLS